VTGELVRERRGGVLVARLNRPEARNALNGALIQGISAAIVDAEADPQIRAIVITGTGDRAFCADMDLREFASGGRASGDPGSMVGFLRLIEGELQQSVFGSRDAQEGALAFVERRAPVWQGR
jgi:enoyl-CoA hydratase/carnithine racemase